MGSSLRNLQSNNNSCRKFFTFTLTLNMVGLVLAASGHWPYGVKYSGAIVVANLNVAVLVRNEVFGRLLYLFVNTFFAKVGTITLSFLMTTDSDFSGLLFGSVLVVHLFCR